MNHVEKINVELANAAYSKYYTDRFGMKYRNPVNELEHLIELRDLVQYHEEQLSEQIVCNGCTMQEVKELITTL